MFLTFKFLQSHIPQFFFPHGTGGCLTLLSSEWVLTAPQVMFYIRIDDHHMHSGVSQRDKLALTAPRIQSYSSDDKVTVVQDPSTATIVFV